MSHRFLTSLSVLAVVSLLVMPVAGQAPVAAPKAPANTTAAQKAGAAQKTTDAAKPWTPPRTPWGDPDLQGIYNYATSTPLQRPRQLGEKQVLSEDEAADLQEELAENLTRDRRDGGAQADVSRAYNDHWMDPKRLLLTADKRTSLIVDPPDGRLPPRLPQKVSPEERAARDLSNKRFNAGFFESYKDMDVGNRCIIRRRNEGGGHPYLPAIYNNMAQIFQTPGYVVIYSEMIHFSRIIPVDGRPHLPSNVETWLGDPRGHWEGNTLVVETANFLSSDDVGRTAVVYGNANPKTFRLVERFTRVAPDVINYEVTMSDPNTWTRPFTISVPWNKTQEQVYEYQCQETNYDMYHWLSSARTREARGEKFDPNSPEARGGDNQAEP